MNPEDVIVGIAIFTLGWLIGFFAQTVEVREGILEAKRCILEAKESQMEARRILNAVMRKPETTSSNCLPLRRN